MSTDFTELDRANLDDFATAIQREWLVTNGIGGYASSTVTGANTRRYHGLLVAALEPPLGRAVMLAKVDEAINVSGRSYELGANEFDPGVVHPQGYKRLTSVRLEGQMPVFRFQVGQMQLEKRVWMDYGKNTTFIQYTYVEGKRPLRLNLRLFTAMRDFHDLVRGDDQLRPEVSIDDSACATISSRTLEPSLHLSCTQNGTFERADEWYWNYVYRVERDRSLEFMEDLYHPLDCMARLAPNESVCLIASAEPTTRIVIDTSRALIEEQDRATTLIDKAGIDRTADPVGAQLVIAADQCLVERTLADEKPSLTVIAGYPWFGDWGRDAMISLPGIALATNRIEAAKGLLRTFAAYMSKGMIPNRFPDVGEVPEYNTVDATLWYFQALHAYLEKTDDEPLLQELLPALKDVASHYYHGTRYNIHVDPADGLVWAGEPGVQLTWMDVKAGDWLPTPRMGKPVEIQALWYSALCLLERWCLKLGEPTEELSRWRAAIEHHFYRKFWYEEGGFLNDVIDGPDGNDAALRPNQIFALSLPFPLLPVDKARRVLAVVSSELLTPVGLRSLAPDDPQYRGRYGGDFWEREGSYHNGTVWGWLIGPYLDAHLRYNGDRDSARALLEGMAAQMASGALGTISEVFDGDPPHTPRGCYAQAWSVAEVLRHWRELCA